MTTIYNRLTRAKLHELRFLKIRKRRKNKNNKNYRAIEKLTTSLLPHFKEKHTLKISDLNKPE